MASLRPWNLFGKTIYAAANPGRHALVIFFFVSRVPALGGLRLFGGVKTQGCADSAYPCPFLKAAEIPLNLAF